MSKEFKNGNNEINQSGEHNSISRNNIKQNQNQIDKSDNKTIIVNNILNKPRRLTPEEVEKLKEQTQRPYLKHKLNEQVCCFGYVVGRYRNSDRFTVINIVDSQGRYVTDHIQLDFKENEFKYEHYESNPTFIQMKGVVKSYNRIDGSLDYEINLSEKPIILSENYYNRTGIINYEDCYNINKINDFLSMNNIEELYKVINKLRLTINTLSLDDFNENFIYDYVINQYMLNTVTYDLYNNSFNNVGVSDDSLIDLIIILSSIVYILNSVEIISLSYIFKFISYICNVLQGVEYDKKSNKQFVDFCKQNLKIEGKNKINKAWNVVYLRKMNFGVDSNPGYDNFNEVLIMSYAVLNKLIK